MKAPTVSKFFCVFDLNLGGLMLGCLGAISNGTFAAILLLNLVFNAARLKHKVFGIAKEFEDISPGAKLVDELVHPTALDEEHISTSVFVFLALIIVGILSVFSFISIWFIRGVKERNPKKLQPFIVLTALATLSALLHGIVTYSLFWILVGMLHIYFVIVLYSLYEMLEFEGEQMKCHQDAASQGYSHHDSDIESDAGSYHGFRGRITENPDPSAH